MPRSTFIPAPPARKLRAELRAEERAARTAPARHVAPLAGNSIEAVFERGLGIFLDMNRRGLAIGAVVACGFLAGVQALPAEADVIHDDVVQAALQSFTSPGAAVLESPAALRDPYSMSIFNWVQWPVPSSTTMSSDFGYRSCAGCSENHLGIDLNPGNGFPVQAIADGIVVESEFSGGLGAHVVIEHVIDGEVVQSQYGHMQGDSLAVSVGERVTVGEQLGLVGSTGQSTGPHLHFGIIIGGVNVDPLPWLLTYSNVAY